VDNVRVISHIILHRSVAAAMEYQCIPEVPWEKVPESRYLPKVKYQWDEEGHRGYKARIYDWRKNSPESTIRGLFKLTRGKHPLSEVHLIGSISSCIGYIINPKEDDENYSYPLNRVRIMKRAPPKSEKPIPLPPLDLKEGNVEVETYEEYVAKKEGRVYTPPLPTEPVDGWMTIYKLENCDGRTIRPP